MKQLKITQGRSAISEKKASHGTLRALGLGRPGKVAHHDDTPQIRGMIRRVAHLVQVKETPK